MTATTNASTAPSPRPSPRGGEGGTSTSPIPLSRVAIDDEVKARVLAAVESGQYILGPECRAFEEELARWFGRRHAVLVSSATAGLLLAFAALDIGPGDEVLVPAHTAFPTIEAIFEAGATPRFVDVDETYTLDPAWLEPRVTARTKAIVPVHLCGHPCDQDAVLGVARRHGLKVVEDCAQAHGALYRGRKVGSYGEAGVLSFYPSKNLTVLGDGGAVLTDDAGLAERVRMLRDHGRRDKHTHEVVGWNLRFNEIQAAAGRVLLRRLDAMNEARRRVAARYGELLAPLPVDRPVERGFARHVYHLYAIRTPRRVALARYLAERGIQTGVHYPLPTHLQPATLARAGVVREPLPRTERFAAELLSLPIFPGLADQDVERVADAIAAFHGTT